MAVANGVPNLSNLAIMKIFADQLRKHILVYQGILQGPQTPIKESLWEFLAHEACVKANLRSVWTPGSHKPGQDIIIEDVAYSCKTTRCNLKGGQLMISSYRLTQKCDGDEKEFIEEIDVKRNNFGYYLLLVRLSEMKRGIETIDRYVVYKIPSEKLKAGKLSWKKDNKGNWHGDSADVPYRMDIQKTMSHQLWIKVPLTYIEEDKLIEIPILGHVKSFDFSKMYDALYETTQQPSPEPQAMAVVAPVPVPASPPIVLE